MNYLFFILILILISYLSLTLSIKFKFNDIPNTRKLHLRPVPLCGGVILYLSILSGLLIFQYDSSLNIIILVSSIIFITGLVDDLFDLNVFLRIILICFASFILFYNNFIITSLGTYEYLGSISLNKFGFLFTVLAVVLLTNSFNFIDGADGVLITNSSLVIIFTIFLDLFLLNYLAFNYDFYFVYFTTMFILFILNTNNFNNLKIFLGDSGSTFIGFFLSFYLINYYLSISIHPILIAWCVAFPVFDLVSITIRRLINKKNPTLPDLTHFHHLVLKLCKTNTKLLLILTLYSILIFATGFLCYLISPLFSLIAFFILFLTHLFLSFFLERRCL